LNAKGASLNASNPSEAAMIDVLIITYNEALNLPPCLQSLSGWVNRVYVVDSGSTDGTQDIARSFDAEVVHHDWPGYAAQRNWALDTLPFESDWTLVLDADEVVTDQLRSEIEAIVSRPVDEVPENGFYINRLTYFLGKPIRHCGYFPAWNMRLFKRGRGRYENRSVHEHVIIDNPVGYIRAYLLHNDRRGLEHFYAKHNRYSSLEAAELFRDIVGLNRGPDSANLTRQTRHRRWLKRNVIRRLPLPGVWRFVYMYILQLGFLDGSTGFQFCRFIAGYDAMVAFKLSALLRLSRSVGVENVTTELETPLVGLAQAEGQLNKDGSYANARHLASEIGFTDRVAASTTTDPQPTELENSEATIDVLHKFAPETSPWSFRGKLARAAWMLAGKPLFRMSFHNWYLFRRVLLRAFGARIAADVRIRPSVNIEIPWQLDLRDGVIIGDHAILYSLGRITIGERCVVSQYAHLCAGTHDYNDSAFRLLRLPITLGRDVWVGADAFIGPETVIGPLAVIGARASVYKSVPARAIVGGNPARILKYRPGGETQASSSAAELKPGSSNEQADAAAPRHIPDASPETGTP